MTHRITLIAFCLFASAAQADTGVTQGVIDRINADLDSIGSAPRGCSNVIARLDVLRQEYPQFHFHFAARNDDTETGIRGCGYGFHTDDATARDRAMAGCTQWEVAFGTDGGTKVCTLR